MAIDWSTIKPTIASQIATLTGLASKFVRWVDEPGGDLAGISPIVWLRVDLPVGVGVDIETRQTNGVANQIVTLIGQREFTLKIRVESFTPNIADEKHAMNIGEAIRTRLRRSTAIQARAGIFTVRQILMSKRIEYIESNRPITAFLLDVLCATVNIDVDDSAGAGNWIGETQGSGPIKNNDGSTIDTPTFDSAKAQ